MRSPTRAPALLTQAPRSHNSTNSRSPIDESRLLHAIHALDQVTSHPAATSAWPPIAQDATRALRAWGFFLDLTVVLEGADSEDARREIALVLEARVLSCVTRFLAGRSRQQGVDEVHDHGRPSWRQWSCPQAGPTGKCLAGVVRTAACCFLYQLSRDPSTAMLVMRSGLYAFLFDECRAMVSDDASTDEDPPASSLYEARDVVIAVDAFDWATRALWASLQRGDRKEASDAFVVPIGARSLAHLVQGHQIPANEAEEYSIVQRTLSPAPCAALPKSPLKSGSPSRHAKPRRLPSMFTFPTRHEDDSHPNCPVCAPRYDTEAWVVAARGSTRLHLAVRAIVALALHIPPASPEGKKFVRDGAVQVLRLAVTATRRVDGEGVASAPEVEHIDAHRAIRETAVAGLRLLEPKKVVVDPLPPRGLRSPKPGKQSTANSVRSPLGDKLRAVSEHTRHEAAQREYMELEAQRAVTRAAARVCVLKTYHKAMATREHLLQSLAVLHRGRSHPAGLDQRVVDWLDSFLTIEKKEQQRREQEELRQRRLLELQYQIDERRRRERDERAAMALHDHDTDDSFAAEKAEGKREAFARLQREMQELKDRQEAEARANADEAMVAQKRESAKREAQRLQLQSDERRRQIHEGELMAREDHYYAEKILREKRQREEQAQKTKLVNPLVEQQKRIEAMRRLDDEKRQSQQELDLMRSEDLLARQRRFLDTEILKKQADSERKARKQMEAEERASRLQWKLLDDALARQQQEQEKQRRADERRAKRWQEQQWKQWQAAWVPCYDHAGNVYYYNQLTGESQWENPLAYSVGATADAAASSQGTF